MRINLECLQPGDVVYYRIYFEDGRVSEVISSKVKHRTPNGLGLRNGQYVSFDHDFKNLDAVVLSTPLAVEQQKKYAAEIAQREQVLKAQYIKRTKIDRARKMLLAIKEKHLDAVENGDLDRIIGELKIIIG